MVYGVSSLADTFQQSSHWGKFDSGGCFAAMFGCFGRMLCRCVWLIGWMLCHLCWVVDLCTLDIVASACRLSCRVLAGVVGRALLSSLCCVAAVLVVFPCLRAFFQCFFFYFFVLLCWTSSAWLYQDCVCNCFLLNEKRAQAWSRKILGFSSTDCFFLLSISINDPNQLTFLIG